MHVVLIGNYPLDRQESMQRFAQMLSSGFRTNGIQVKNWQPIIFFGAPFSTTVSGIGKWFGYLDKWILFPLVITWRRLLSRKNTCYHICDHSNAPYLRFLPKESTAITCHDVLAIQSGLGFSDTHVSTSKMGTILQKWILRHLSTARNLATVSQYTFDELNKLTLDNRNRRNWQIIPNSFNDRFHKIDSDKAETLLLKFKISAADKFILHVGSDLPRKNRKLLLDTAACLGARWSGKICYAGHPIDERLKRHAESLGLHHRIISVEAPDHEMLLALYSRCDAFIFPSLSEGFGWPVIEAQACGAPVIASNIQPMPEVGGAGALYADPTRPEEFASALTSLQNASIKNELTKRGLQNIARYRSEVMMEKYLKLHRIDAIVPQNN